MKEFLSKKGLGFFFTVAGVILNLVGVILFAVSRECTSSVVIILEVLAMVSGVGIAVKHFKFTEFVPFIFSAISLALVAGVLLETVTQIWFKNNVVGLSSTIIPGLVFIALGAIACACAVVAKHEK